MYRLTNVPRGKDPNAIVGEVSGATINIINRSLETKAQQMDRSGWVMTDFSIGDHLMEKPELLRQMVADTVATAIRMARDVGYKQALADVRAALGVE